MRTAEAGKGPCAKPSARRYQCNSLLATGSPVSNFLSSFCTLEQVDPITSPFPQLCDPQAFLCLICLTIWKCSSCWRVNTAGSCGFLKPASLYSSSQAVGGGGCSLFGDNLQACFVWLFSLRAVTCFNHPLSPIALSAHLVLICTWPLSLDHAPPVCLWSRAGRVAYSFLFTATPANKAAPAVAEWHRRNPAPHDSGVGWRRAPFSEAGWWLLGKEVRGSFRAHHGNPWSLSKMTRHHPILPGRAWAGSACSQ